MAGVWLKDVALAAGVSVSAASHAVNRTGTLAEATRRKVLEAAERIGYRRNPHLSAIAARRFRQAGHFTPIACLSFFDGAARHRVPGVLKTEALEGELQKLGMQIVETGNYLDLEAARKVLDQLFNRGVEGIFLGNVSRPELLASLDFGRFCVLGLGDMPSEAGVHRIEPNWIQAVQDGFRHLHEVGCQRIGAIFPSQTPLSDQDRLRIGAYRGESEAWEKSPGLPIFTRLDGRGLVSWYRQVRPDGLIVHGVPMIYRLIESGVAIPDKVRAVLAMRASEADEWSKRFPGAVMNASQMRTTAARMLYDMITHEERGRPTMARSILCQTSWVNPGGA